MNEKKKRQPEQEQEREQEQKQKKDVVISAPVGEVQGRGQK